MPNRRGYHATDHLPVRRWRPYEKLVLGTTVALPLLFALSLLVPKVMGRSDKEKIRAVHSDFKALEIALTSFSEDCRHYPTTKEGLDALLAAPEGCRRWKGPYFRGAGVPLDPWQTEYVYESTGSSYEITSYGSDKDSGGDGVASDLVTRS